ncbi:hypothetical protein V5H08_11875 [Vibrio cholerae]|uniref:hypothetical protein n=1 Tax=Vibrio cholerae TaxID=666 RepID=UPI00396757A2|nr:hypothetical protein [Vibrio cholerae]HCJ7280653.1 hypothetical protein [Vibrio cholerae]HCJ7318307.1 hypothetical protein [Vibrio cholerae]
MKTKTLCIVTLALLMLTPFSAMSMYIFTDVDMSNNPLTWSYENIWLGPIGAISRSAILACFVLWGIYLIKDLIKPKAIN